eukprot:4013605-Alexandrium_andersonii.AAC.1
MRGPVFQRSGHPMVSWRAVKHVSACGSLMSDRNAAAHSDPDAECVGRSLKRNADHHENHQIGVFYRPGSVERAAWLR